MSQDRRISIIIPVRNGGEYLLRCLWSVERVARGAAHSLIDVVVVDDGAECDLSAIVDSSQLHFPVTVVRGPQRGVSRARNTGAMVATGEYLLFLDVDDMMLSPFGMEAGRIDDSTQGVSLRFPSILLHLGNGVMEQLGPSWCPACYLVPRSVFFSVGGFREDVRWGEHHVLGDDIARAGHSVEDVPSSEPVMIRFEDRSRRVRRGYAEHRLAASLDLRHGCSPGEERARNSETAAVSCARLDRWREASEFARRALTDNYSARRRMRLLLLRLPGLRWMLYSGIPIGRDVWGSLRCSSRDLGRRLRRNADLIAMRHWQAKRADVWRLGSR